MIPQLLHHLISIFMFFFRNELKMMEFSKNHIGYNKTDKNIMSFKEMFYPKAVIIGCLISLLSAF